MTDAELDALLQRLRDDGILPQSVKGSPAHIRKLYASQLAQIVRSAVEQRQRWQDDDALLSLLLIA